jgi:type III secretion system-like peptide-binding chaperone
MDPDKPAEASLIEDPESMDLPAKVGRAWVEFGAGLNQVLAGLAEQSELSVTLDPTAAGLGEALYQVSVLAVAGGLLRAYAVGNHQLPPEHRLARGAVAELVALGWAPPGLTEGSNERFGLQLAAGQAERLSAIMVRTLRDVYGTPHPAFLVYQVVGPDHEPVEVPALGAARPANSDGHGVGSEAELASLPLPQAVATVVAAMLKTTPENLPVDEDGDIGIRSGSAMVFVRVRDTPPLVEVFSPVLTEVPPTEKLLVRLSDLTHRMPIGRLYHTNETVWASVPVFGRDFQASHLMLAVQVMTGLADELDDRLHGEFGGRRFFSEDKVGPDAVDGTGMYL